MALSLAATIAVSGGNAVMWARFVDQTATRSHACMLNEAVTQVALHQVALIGLSFAFFNHIGYLTLPYAVVGGVCLVPILWLVLYKFGCIDVATMRLGMNVLMHAAIGASIVAAGCFVMAGSSVFGISLGGILLFDQLRRANVVSLKVSWITEGAEFAIANIAAVLIGTWYHRLRALADLGLRLREFYVYRMLTSAVGARTHTQETRQPYENLKVNHVSKLTQIELFPVLAHIDWGAITLPQEPPKGVQLDDYIQLANEVCIEAHVDHMRSGSTSDDYAGNEPKGDKEYAAYIRSKVISWLENIKTDHVIYEDQSKQIRRYALWNLKKLMGQSPEDQAYYLRRLSWNIQEGVGGCPEGSLNVAEEVYGELAHPDLPTVKQKVSYALQGLRRHLLHRFIKTKFDNFPKWVINPEERHIVNGVLRVLRQRGTHLGLPEEKTAISDTYYAGGLTEALFWKATADFDAWFSENYTAGEMLSSIQSAAGNYKDSFDQELYNWLSGLDSKDLDVSQFSVCEEQTAAARIHNYDEDGRATIKNEYIYALLINLGVLTPSPESIEYLEQQPEPAF